MVGRGSLSSEHASKTLLRHAGLLQSLNERVAVGEIGEVPTEHAEPDRGAELVARGDVLLRFLDQAEMPAAADQRMVLAHMLGRGDGGAKVRQRLLELSRAKKREAVDRRVEAGKAVDRAHAQGPSGLHKRLVEMTSAQQRPSEHDVAEREARVQVERGWSSPSARSC